MIGYLSGTVLALLKSEVIIDVNGVGYRVRVSQKHEARSTKHETIELFIHTAVREDAITLYGFETLAELQMFELLLDVSGVGPKTAMTIVTTQSPTLVEAAVRQADVDFFQKVPGIGKKSAQRIIVDLKGKIPSLTDIDLSDTNIDSDVMQALKQFGFREREIHLALKQIDTNLPIEVQVREGLKLLGKG